MAKTAWIRAKKTWTFLFFFKKGADTLKNMMYLHLFVHIMENIFGLQLYKVL